MKKIVSLILCGVCAFTVAASAGCQKNSSEAGSTDTTESTGKVTEALDIFDGNFTAITLTQLQAFATNIVYAEGVVKDTLDGKYFDVEKEILTNNVGTEFSVKSGDPEGSQDNHEATGKVLNEKGEFFYRGPEQRPETGDYTIYEVTYETYCDGETVYEKGTVGETVEKTKFDGDISYGLNRLNISVPDLKEWEEGEGATCEYYWDETDEAYTKIKIIVKATEKDMPNTPLAQTREYDVSIVYVFSKQYKLQAFSYSEEEITTYRGETSAWQAEYMARPWSGEIQAPEDLSVYQEKVK